MVPGLNPPSGTKGGPKHQPLAAAWAMDKVRAWDPGLPGGPVVYAAAASGPGAKERLAARLLGELDGRGGVEVKRVQLTSDSLGRPRLLIDGRRGPRLSFSHDGGLTFGALSRTSGVGVDLAHEADFGPDYPIARAFTSSELRCASGICPSLEQSAALLWSLKEAAVKALGTGFHTVDPREVRCSDPTSWGPGFRFGVSAPMGIRAWARPLGPRWMALAAL